MAAAILEGHVTRQGREEGHVTNVTSEQLDWKRGREIKMANNWPLCIIRQKHEKEINSGQLKGAGSLSLTKNGKRENAKPFLV